MPATTLTVVFNDGNRAPWLAFGTGTALFARNVTKFVQAAIEHGITHLDGAQGYRNEEYLGAGIKLSGKPRTDLFIVTKLKELEFSRRTHGQSVKQALEESLRKLGVDYVDLFLINSPRPADEEGTLKDLWKAMEGVKKAGLAKSIGVSNFRVNDLKEIIEDAEIIPAVNQLELHPYVWRASKPIVDLCVEKGIAIAAYASQVPLVRWKQGPVNEVLSRVSDRLGQTFGQPVTSGQVLTKWLIQKGFIVVTTTTKISQMKSFVGAEVLPNLTAQEIHDIEEAGGREHCRIYMQDVFDD